MQKGRFVSEINVTPFVDVMLVLLIIFMVTVPMMTEGMEVNLPKTQHVDRLPAQSDNMVLTITKEGILYLDKYEITENELEDKLKALVLEKNKQLFLQADSAVPYGTVVSVMGRVRKSGIDKLGVLAKHESPTR